MKFIISHVHFHQTKKGQYTKKRKRKMQHKLRSVTSWPCGGSCTIYFNFNPSKEQRQDFSLPGKALLHARKWDPVQHIKQLSFLCSNQWMAHPISHIEDGLSFHGRASHKPTSSGQIPHAHGNQATYRGGDVAMMQACLPRLWIPLNPRWAQTGWVISQCVLRVVKHFKRKKK